jgi:hypothetical protein
MKALLLKIEEEIYIQWKARAKAEGLTLSAWIRSRCNEVAQVQRETVLPPSPVESRNEQLQKVRQNAQPRSKATCEHGTEKGYRCWQCRGIAKIGKEAE